VTETLPDPGEPNYRNLLWEVLDASTGLALIAEAVVHMSDAVVPVPPDER
jgi:hypothetical protein